MESHDYFHELTIFYKLTLSKLFYKGSMPWCCRILISDSKIFNKTYFDHDKFLQAFNLLKENEKEEFFNILVRNTLIPITPLEIKIILAFYFKEDKQKINLLLFDHKYYFDFVKENNEYFTQVIFHASEYYSFYLEKCYFPDELFKKEIMAKLKKIEN
jgi:hypothetical protein